MLKKTIFITGCSSGIGKDIAIALSKRGHRVIASCRRVDDVVKLQTLNLEAILLDLNDSTSIQAGFNELMEMTNHQLDVLINNAGFGQMGALEDLSRDLLRAQFETNVFGLMELTNLVIPIMRKRNTGRIINMSSILGIISLPFRGAYNASKYAVEGLSDTLRLELSQTGIKVITIEPGPIESNFRKNAIDSAFTKIDWKKSIYQKQYTMILKSFEKKKSTSIFTKKSTAVVQAIIHAIEAKKPKIKYPITFPAHIFILLKRFFSTKLLDFLLLCISKKELS